VLYDSTGKVLSLPPIINGDHSKIKVTTKNVFIECTATDLTKAKIVLNTVVTMFSTYCKKPFSVEPVEVVYPDGSKVVLPDLSERTMNAKVSYINSCVGVDCTPETLCDLVAKMSCSATLNKDKSELIVTIPPTRSDILHACDIMEDCAIAYNINKIVETTPKASTVAVPLPINKLADMLRKECAYAGYTEVLAFTLCSHDENFKFLNKKDQNEAVLLANPKTIEYQVVRTSLMPGILKTIGANKHLPLPLKIFEVSDVVLRDETVERRARNQRNICALYCNKTSGFEVCCVHVANSWIGGSFDVDVECKAMQSG
jgi:phenylalanyl-tRNA synthetase beta chain